MDQDVREQVRSFILESKHEPNRVFTERFWAGEVDVSRTKIREALAWLGGEKILDAIRDRMPDEIKSSIMGHLTNSIRRWFPSKGLELLRILQ